MSRKHKINQLKVKKEFREIDDLKEVNKSTIKLILEQIKTQLREMYLFPEKVDQLCDALDTDYRKQVYNDITEPATLVKALTKTLQNNVPDKHLQVQLPSETYGYPEKTHPFYGIEKAEILPENIGCITINSFLPLDISQNTVLGAMQFVRDTEALIIDLRKCRGGSADSANFLLSYFFKEANTLLLKTFKFGVVGLHINM
ncbi:MAG: S41 family peptidase [Promethearchaeota archaeon]